MQSPSPTGQGPWFPGMVLGVRECMVQEEYVWGRQMGGRQEEEGSVGGRSRAQVDQEQGSQLESEVSVNRQEEETVRKIQTPDEPIQRVCCSWLAETG